MSDVKFQLLAKKRVCVITKNNEIEEDNTSTWKSKLFVIDKSLGIAGCGLKTDLKIVINRARKISKNFSYVFGKQIPVNQLANELSKFFQEFTYSGGVRPFGLSIFIIGFSNEGPELFQINPDGNLFCIKANIIGKKSKFGLPFLNKRWNKKLCYEEMLSIGFLSLKETNDDTLKVSNVNVAILEDSGDFKILNKKHIASIFPGERSIGKVTSHP